MGYVQQHQQQSQQEEQREAAAATTNSTQINCAHYKQKIVASLSLSLLTALPDATRNYEMCTCVSVCTFVLLVVVVVFADLLLIAPDIFALSFMAAAR